MSKADALAKQSQSIEVQAQHFAKIQTPEQQDAAGALLKAIKGASKEIDEWCDPNIKRWHEGHRQALAQKKDLQGPLKKAETVLKRAIGAYQAAVQRKALEAKRKAEAEARAAAEAAKAAEEAELRAQGDDDLADIVKEMPTQVPVVVPEVAPAAPEGISTRETVKVEVIDKKAALEYILAHWELFNHWVDIPLKGPRTLAQQQREAFKVPGIKMWIETGVSVR